MDEKIKTFLTENDMNFLIWGLSGAGKSMLAATFPRFGRKLIVDVFDPGGTSLYRRLIPADELDMSYWAPSASLALSSHAKTKGKNEKVPKIDKEVEQMKEFVWVPWAKRFHERLENGDFQNAAAYVVDTTSFMSKAAVERQLWLADRPGGVPDVEMGDFTALKHGQIRAFAMQAAVPCPTIFLAHEVVKADWENRGNKLHELNVAGSARAELPAMCKEVYHVSGQAKGGKVGYVLKAFPDNIHTQCKTEIGMFGGYDVREDITIDPRQPVNEQGLTALFRKALASL